MNGKKLLADLLDLTPEELEKIIRLRNRYSLKNLKKKNGSFRIIHAPNQTLRGFQRKLLKHFLYKIPLKNDFVIHGFLPKKSHITNARTHAKTNNGFVLRLDLKDAFPSVKTKHLKSVLKKIVEEEIQNFQDGKYKIKPLFPVKKVSWFRRLIKEEPRQLNLFQNPTDYKKVTDEFIELALSLVTYQGKLPQGAPTSPYLLNIVLCFLGPVAEMEEFLRKRNMQGARGVSFSIYADDFTFSSSHPISKSMVEDLIRLIETKSPFKVNREKILYFRRSRIAPLVTGLRLVRLAKSREELEAEYREALECLPYAKQANPRVIKNIVKKSSRQAVDEDEQWVIGAVHAPKEQIRKVRGLIHRAITDPTLRLKVEGHIANLKAIYGNNLPRQITVPYKKYQETIRG